MKGSIEIRQLEAFVAVVQVGSFTLAAERLCLTQPSLSARIQQLEASLGGQLFERRSRPMSLTPMGEIFLPYAERVLGVLETGRGALETARSGFAGRLAVGTPVSVATYLMPQVVDLFSKQFPQAALFLETSHSTNIVQQLQDGLLDLVFTAVLPQLVEQLDILFRIQDEMVVAVSERHPLAVRANLSWRELWEYRVVLPRWGSGFETYIESIRELSDPPRPMVHAPLAVASMMVSRGDVVTFVPRRVTAATRMIPISVVDFHYPWDVVLVTRPGRTLSPLEQGFLDTVKDVLQDGV